MKATAIPFGTQPTRCKSKSDDPDDLTLRQARLLGQADTVFHTPAIAPAILNRARADANRVACNSPPEAPPAGLSLFLDNI